MKKLKTIINALVAMYPEQDKLINEILENVEYLRYDTFDSDDAITAIHIIDNITADFWEILENENLDSRDLSDMQYSIVITDIKQKAVELDAIIDNYRQDAISKYSLFIA